MKKNKCSFSVALVVLPKRQLTLTRFLVSGVVVVLVVKKATLTSSVAFESATLTSSVAFESATLTLHVSVASATLKLHVSVASAARWLYELC